MQEYNKLKVKGLSAEGQLVSQRMMSDLSLSFSDTRIRQSLIFKADSVSFSLETSVFHDFVDRYLIRPLRKPDINIPVHLIEEKMQGSFNSTFQEYVFKMSKQYSVLQDEKDVRKNGNRLVTSLEIINKFFLSNKENMIKDLLKVENENLYKKFYQLRWFQLGQQNNQLSQLKQLSQLTSSHI